MSVARQIFDQAFSAPRDPRSIAYKKGVLAALEFRLGECSGIARPYRLGTADADAYFSGLDEGHRRATAHLDGAAGQQQKCAGGTP